MVSRPLFIEVQLATISGVDLATELIPGYSSVKTLNDVLTDRGYKITEGTQYLKDSTKLLASALDVPITEGLWYVVENQLEMGHLFRADDMHRIADQNNLGVRVDCKGLHAPMFLGISEWDPIWRVSALFVPTERPKLSWEFELSAYEQGARVYHSFIDAAATRTGLEDGVFVHDSGEAGMLSISIERGIPRKKDLLAERLSPRIRRICLFRRTYKWLLLYSSSAHMQMVVASTFGVTRMMHSFVRYVKCG